MNPNPRIRLVSPARFVDESLLDQAMRQCASHGLMASASPGCHLRHHRLAGDDLARANDLIAGWNAPDSDLLWCARGGYGSGRLLQHLNGQLEANGRVFVGYSDQTFLLAYIARHGLGVAAHGPMAIDLARPEKQPAVESLLKRIAVEDFSFDWQSSCGGLQVGAASGPVVVGNLSILTRLIGTPIEPVWDNAILVVEDVGEYPHAIDRMFLHLSQAGVFSRISGLCLGDFTLAAEDDIPFGESVAEMALRHVSGGALPVAFGLPIGHGVENRIMVFGAPGRLECGANGCATLQIAGRPDNLPE